MIVRQTAPRWESQPEPRPVPAAQPSAAAGLAAIEKTNAGGVLTAELDVVRAASRFGVNESNLVHALQATAEESVGGPTAITVHDLSEVHAPVRGYRAGGWSSAFMLSVGPEHLQPWADRLPDGGAGMRVARVRSVSVAWRDDEDAARASALIERIADDSRGD